MKQPHITIIILHYKSIADTQECLKSLQKIDYQNYNVLVVNNDSKEHAQSLKDNFFDIQIIQNEKNLGFAEGNNVGIRHALKDDATDAVLLLNNDTTVEPSFLSEITKIDADMVAPRMLDYNDHDKIDNLGIVLMASGLPFNRLNENQKLFCPSGGCALYSRKLLESVAIDKEDPHPSPLPPARRSLGVGGSTGEGVYYFDPTYFCYTEDLDLGWRARNAGLSAGYATNAIVYHKGSASTSKLSDFAVYHTYRNLLWTQFKNLPAILLLWQSPWLFAGHIFIFFNYILKGRTRVIFKSYINGEAGTLLMFNKRSQALKKKTVSNKKVLSWFETGLFPKNLI